MKIRNTMKEMMHQKKIFDYDGDKPSIDHVCLIKLIKFSWICRQIMMSSINLEATWISVSAQQIKLFNSYRSMISMAFFFRSLIRVDIKICYFYSNITSKLPTADKKLIIKKSSSETE
jgi:hypothetical protein